MRRLALSIGLVAIVRAVHGAPAAAEMPGVDWKKLAEPDVVRILTIDDDGATRDTKVWITWFDGNAYIRTGDSRWHANLERDPVAVLRSGGVDVQVRVEHVSDERIRARQEEAVREKYGFQAAVLGLFGDGGENLLRLRAVEE
jgi:hypothetical protein